MFLGLFEMNMNIDGKINNNDSNKWIFGFADHKLDEFGFVNL